MAAPFVLIPHVASLLTSSPHHCPDMPFRRPLTDVHSRPSHCMRQYSGRYLAMWTGAILVSSIIWQPHTLDTASQARLRESQLVPIRSRASPDARPLRAGPFLGLAPGRWLIPSHAGPRFLRRHPVWCNLASPSSRKREAASVPIIHKPHLSPRPGAVPQGSRGGQ